MNSQYIDKITLGDSRKLITELENNSIDLFLSDIPYGISLDDWDVLHNNTNSALLGKSPAQEGKSGFKRRGKPINGWAQSDRNIGKEYEEWCESWTISLFDKMKPGSFLFVFGARRTIHHVTNSFEKSGFLLKDILAWEKPNAHHRAQRISGIFKKRGLHDLEKKWEGWRLGNLAPIYEPVLWFMKPYKIGSTITDNVIEYEVGAMNTEGCQINGGNPTNLLKFGFRKNERGLHEAQKPVELLKFLVTLTTRENQTVLDPFMGSGSTAIACIESKRKYIGFEMNPGFREISNNRIQSTHSKDDTPLFR